MDIMKGGTSKDAGASIGKLGGSKVSQLTQAIDWLTKGGGKQYGDIDIEKIAVSGQSCGGLEAYSASYQDSRVKLTMIFNVGVFDKSRRYLMSELKAPIAWFLRGPLDGGYLLGQRDYDILSKGVPALLASLDAGHMGPYAAPNAGKFGKAGVSFLEWQFRGNETEKAKFMDPNSQNGFVKDHWNVTSKNF